jgi:energy-converting hydrogenase Eha subunit F
MLTGPVGAYDGPSIESMPAFILAEAFFYTRKLWQIAHGDITHKTYRVRSRDARTAQGA